MKKSREYEINNQFLSEYIEASLENSEEILNHGHEIFTGLKNGYEADELILYLQYFD